jgi:hypothetical protein
VWFRFTQIVFGTLIALGHRTLWGGIVLGGASFDRAEFIRFSASHEARSGDHRAAANAAGSQFKPRAQAFAGFNFAMCAVTSSSVAHPRKYRQILS